MCFLHNVNFFIFGDSKWSFTYIENKKPSPTLELVWSLCTIHGMYMLRVI